MTWACICLSSSRLLQFWSRDLQFVRIIRFFKKSLGQINCLVVVEN